MTDTISDEARELTLELYHRYTGNKWLESDGDIDIAPVVQALTAAECKGAEKVLGQFKAFISKYLDDDTVKAVTYLIDEMKVKP